MSQNADVRPKKYTVLVHGVRVDEFSNQRQEEGIREIYRQNPAIKEGVKILRLHWRKHVVRLKKTVSSLILDVGCPDGANALIREGLVLEGELKEVELFDAQCLVMRCYRCQKYGHNARNCKNQQRCGHCAAPGHGHEECQFKDQEAKRRCANCIGKHIAGSRECPKQEEEICRARQAREAKPRYFAVPVGKIPPPVKVQFFETVAATGKRQAKEPPIQEGNQRTAARKPRGRPRQVLATQTDGRLGNFFSQTPLQEGSQLERDTQSGEEDVWVMSTQGTQELETENNTTDKWN